jgi:hypothetical protein
MVLMKLENVIFITFFLNKYDMSIEPNDLFYHTHLQFPWHKSTDGGLVCKRLQAVCRRPKSIG